MTYRWDGYSLDADALRLSGPEGELHVEPQVFEVLRLEVEPIAVDAYAGIDVFLTVFERVANDGPVVIAIDDLQWTDDPTRSSVSRLHRLHRERDLVTVSTYRSGRDDPPPEVHQWIRGQLRDGTSLAVDLADLDESAAVALIENVIGVEQAVDGQSLYAATGGHCLFLTESLRDVRVGGSGAETVAELIIARLDRQPDNVRSIARTAAIAFHRLGAVPLVSIEAAIDDARLAATQARANKQFDLALRLLQRVCQPSPQPGFEPRCCWRSGCCSTIGERRPLQAR